MNVYVALGDVYLEGFSTVYTDKTQVEVVLDDTTVDLSKLQGYKVEGEDGVNHLVFDPDLYAKWQALQQAQADAIAVQQKLQQLMRELALSGASDTDAVAMAVLYPKWSGDSVSYTTGQRVQYDGKLWKVLQGHTSQSTWTPDAATSLFEEVKS